MNNDIISIKGADGNFKDYRILLVLNHEYKYIIYTDLGNTNFKENLYVAKVKTLDNLNETLELTDDEWQLVEEEYKKIIDVEK